MSKCKCLSASALKIIALVTMLIDHFGHILYYWMVKYNGYPQEIYTVLRAVGRISFPLYCFLLVEGFVHTKNLKKYFFNIALFALISEIPYDIMVRYKPFNFSTWNIFFTLFAGLFTLYCTKKVKEGKILYVFGMIIPAVAAQYLGFDYGAWGVLLILVMYLVRQIPVTGTLVTTLALAVKQNMAFAAVIPMMMYNGEKGRLKMKYFFYAIYPIHIAVFTLIRYLLYGF